MFFRRGWKQVVVHADHHRDKYDRVVEKMYLGAELREEQLQKTDRDRRVEPVVVRKRLPLQNRVFDVVPELNNQRDRPPLTRGSGKAFAEYPNSNEHYEGITVVQDLSSDEPRKEETQDAVCTRPWPAEHVNLKGLREVFGPVREYDEHKQVERPLVPNGIQLLVHGVKV